MDFTADDIVNYIEESDWKSAFEGGTIAAGAKLARAKQVQQVRGEFLEQG